MYSPKFLPTLSGKTTELPPMRFGMTHTEGIISCDDPGIDPCHIHGYLEIYFNVSGEVGFLVNDKLYPVSPGNAIISRPNDVHVCVYKDTSFHEYFCLWIDADLSSPAFAFLGKEGFSPSFSFREAETQQLVSLLNRLFRLHKTGENDFLATVCLLEILFLLNDEKTEEIEESALPEAFRHIIDDIRLRYAEIRSVNDILSTHFVSSSTLTRWFRTYINTSPREYLESQKLAGALKRLKDGASVTEACINSGFSDCAHFIARFKTKFGETPLQYKRRMLGALPQPVKPHL